MDTLTGKRGRFSADVRLDGGENGGDGVGDAEKEYLWWPGPTLMGRGDGGVGGEDEGETKPFLTISSNETVISQISEIPVLEKHFWGKHFPGRGILFEF